MNSIDVLTRDPMFGVIYLLQKATAVVNHGRCEAIAAQAFESENEHNRVMAEKFRIRRIMPAGAPTYWPSDTRVCATT